ncbi:hypothetical protein AGMMS49991_07850 [Spirochaetia bacterium]|nr:hypothetical protein AGMMS49991_07850 [Spirochaetia bacterium]
MKQKHAAFSFTMAEYPTAYLVSSRRMLPGLEEAFDVLVEGFEMCNDTSLTCLIEKISEIFAQFHTTITSHSITFGENVAEDTFTDGLPSYYISFYYTESPASRSASNASLSNDWHPSDAPINSSKRYWRTKPRRTWKEICRPKDY